MRMVMVYLCLNFMNMPLFNVGYGDAVTRVEKNFRTYHAPTTLCVSHAALARLLACLLTVHGTLDTRQQLMAYKRSK